MSYFLHKTIRKPCNIIDVISGRYIKSIENPQYILNLHTYFELRYLIQNQNDMKLFRVYSQLFMSKVYSICNGPISNDVTTFFALRDNDIIQLVYSEDETLFILKFRIALPQLLISSNYVYFSDPILIISSARGSICSFDFSSSNNNLTFNEKTTNCVLTNFSLDNENLFGRIEAGPTLCIYNKSPFSLYMKKDYTNAKITCAFGLPNNKLALCKIGKITIIGIESGYSDEIDIPLPISDPNHENQDRYDFVVYASRLDETSNILLTSFGKVLRMQNMNIEIIYKEYELSQIFPLTPEFVLLTLKGQDHTVINLNLASRRNFREARVSKISSCVGQNGLFLGSQIPYLAPHTYSYCDNIMLLGKQGIGVVSFQAPFDCGEPINGLFSFTVQNRFYVLVSFPNNSRLLELTDRQTGVLRQTQALSFRENVTTIGVCHLFANNGQQYLCQLSSECMSLHGPEKEPSTISYQTKIIKNYASNKKQIVLVLGNRAIQFLQIREPPQKGFDVDDFEIPWNVTAIALSPPDPTTGFSKYTAYGFSESVNSYSVSLQVLSSDPSVRQFVLSEKMPSKVESIKFFDQNDPELTSSKIVIGLENGAIIVASIDQRKKIFDYKTLIHFGTGPCRLSYLPISKKSQGILAVNSRPILITIANGMPRFCPLAIGSSDYAISVQDQDKFILASGSKLNICTLVEKGLSSRDETAMSTARFPLPARIVKLCPMRTDRYVLIACSNALFIFDSLKGSLLMKEPLQTFPEEELRDLSLLEDRSMSLLALCSIKKKPQIDPKECLSKRDQLMTVVRLYQIKSTQAADQMSPPIIGECPIPSTAICIGTSSAIFVACIDTMLCFKPCDGALQIVARINNIGLNVRHLVYVPPSKHAPKGGIYAGDLSRSVKLFHFSEKSKQFKIKCEEGNTRHITALAKYEDSLVCGGDVLGNIFILEYPSISLSADAVLDKKLFIANRRFENKLNFFIGDPITGVQYTATHFSCLWYSTLSGGLGGFISIPKTQIQGMTQISPVWEAEYNRKVQMLKYLEQELSSFLMALCQCDSIAFRNRYYASSHVIDLDLIEMYSNLNDDRKTKLALRVSEHLKMYQQAHGGKLFEPLTPKSIEYDINSFKKYFIEWSAKQ